MRVALFSGNYNYLREGANQALNRLVDHLERRRGYRVRVYSPVTETPAFEPAGTLVPVPSVPLPIRNEFRLALGLPGHVRDDIRSFRPDIVHVSTPDILNSRAQTLARRLDVPIVASQHTRFETYLAYYRLGWLSPLTDAHLRRFYRRSDRILCPTAALAADMRRVCGDRVSVWSRGVDHALFNPARRDLAWRRGVGIADEEIAILFFGRLVLEKGVQVFIDTVKSLQAKGAKVRAIAVGAGPADTLFASLPGSILPGHLDGRDLARAIASADIMLNPSTTETFGNVILEAMASGLAVVSANAPNAHAIMVHGRTGLIPNRNRKQDYADALLGLIERPAERARIGQAAREASLGFTWEAACENVVEAYQAALATKPRRCAINNSEM